MHAAAYNRSRAEHLAWSKRFVSTFARLLRERQNDTVDAFTDFHRELHAQVPARGRPPKRAQDLRASRREGRVAKMRGEG